MVAYMPEYIYASLMIALACIAIEATAAWYRTVPLLVGDLMVPYRLYMRYAYRKHPSLGYTESTVLCGSAVYSV